MNFMILVAIYLLNESGNIESNELNKYKLKK